MAEYTPKVSDNELRRMFAANHITDEHIIFSALNNPKYRAVYEQQYEDFIANENEKIKLGISTTLRR